MYEPLRRPEPECNPPAEASHHKPTMEKHCSENVIAVAYEPTDMDMRNAKKHIRDSKQILEPVRKKKQRGHRHHEKGSGKTEAEKETVKEETNVNAPEEVKETNVDMDIYEKLGSMKENNAENNEPVGQKPQSDPQQPTKDTHHNKKDSDRNQPKHKKHKEIILGDWKTLNDLKD